MLQSIDQLALIPQLSSVEKILSGMPVPRNTRVLSWWISDSLLSCQTDHIWARHLDILWLIWAFLFTLMLLLAVVWGICEVSVHHHRKQLRHLVDNLPVPICLIRKSRGNMEYVCINKRAKKLIALQDEHHNSHLSFNTKLKNACAHVLRTNGPVQFLDNSRDNKTFSVFLNTGTVLKRSYVVQTMSDNSELVALKEEAIKNDRKMDVFIESISHEVRTPLNTILGFSQLLTELPPEEREEAVQLIEEKSDQLHTLINDIILLSMLANEQIQVAPTTFDLYEWLNQVATYYASHKRHTQEVDLDFCATGGSCTVHIDKQLLFSIIANILSNAIKFTQQGGIDVGVVTLDGETLIYIQDTGIGMEPAQITTMFDQFAKVDMFTQGTGLGMPICKEITTLLMGQIGVWTSKGIGTTVLFRFHPEHIEHCMAPPPNETIKQSIQEAIWVVN